MVHKPARGQTRGQARPNPLEFGAELGGWTLLKDEYLPGRGYDRVAADIQLYNRPLAAVVIRALAE